MATLYFSRQSAPLASGDHRVYFKQNWADDWQQLFGAHCLEATHSVAPAMSTASVEWIYGPSRKIQIASVVDEIKGTATEKTRWFVRVVFDCEFSEANGTWSTREWVGVVEDAHDQQGGAPLKRNAAGEWEAVATGVVTLTCYGLEKLLHDSVIRSSFVNDFVGEVGRSLDFNLAAGRPGLFANMSEQEGPLGVHVFENLAGEGNHGKPWTSLQIVRYLLAYHGPQNELGLHPITFKLDAPNGAPPDWDEPRLIARDGISTGALLNQLIDRRRWQTWHVKLNDQGEPTVVVETLASQPVGIDLPDADPIPANRNQLVIRHGTDQLTGVAVKNANVPVVDQVIVRGPLQRYVGTFGFGRNFTDDWIFETEIAYDKGASDSPGYDTASTKEKQRRNAMARGAAKFDHVYSRFRIPTNWDFKVGVPFIENPHAAPDELLFRDDLGAVDKQPYSSLVVERTMPLLVGGDYSGDRIKTNQVDLSEATRGKERGPLVLFWRPDAPEDTSPQTSTVQNFLSQQTNDPVAGGWARAQDIGRQANAERSTESKTDLDASSQNENFSVAVKVPPRSTAIELRVIGEAGQHAIAAVRFSRLPVDERLGGLDFGAEKPMLVTLSLTGCRHVEARWPEFADARDAVRVKLINAGDHYPRDYVAPDTVVDVDADGNLVKSDGGWFPLDANGNDNRDKLRAIAKASAEWYATPHKQLAISSFDLKAEGSLPLGALVTTCGGQDEAVDAGHAQDVNAIISQVTIQTPRGRAGNKPPEAKMQVMTWAGELDPSPASPVIPVRGRQAVAAGPDSSMLQRLQTGQTQMAPGFRSPEEAAFFNNDIEMRNSFQRAGLTPE